MKVVTRGKLFIANKTTVKKSSGDFKSPLVVQGEVVLEGDDTHRRPRKTNVSARIGILAFLFF